MKLFHAVVAILDGHGIAHCLIGASALATHGLVRSTLDLDLLAADGRVLRAETWSDVPGGTSVELLRGDVEDALLGTARLALAGARPVDVVVGRKQWMADVVSRAKPIGFGGTTIRQPRLEDLLALKLDAGGVRDLADVRDALDEGLDPELREKVDALVTALPERVRRRWQRILDQPRS